jgi:hypothetical protein
MTKMKKLPIYNIVLGDCEGISKMSLVEFPAVESNFLAFEEQKPLQFSINEEERIVFGPSLRADFPIYRFNQIMGEFYVVFSKETIKELYEKFMIEQKFNNVNLEHTTDTNGVFLIQSFLKDTEHGIDPKGFEECENGSWFTGYKVLNDEVWEKVKEGTFQGFSVELFSDLEIINEPKDEIEELIEELLSE